MEVVLKPSAQAASAHLHMRLLGQAIAPGEPRYDELRAACNCLTLFLRLALSDASAASRVTCSNPTLTAC